VDLQNKEVECGTLEDLFTILPTATLRTFFRYGKWSGDLIALYLFYIYTARKQKTNRPWCTRRYISQGLNWPAEKVKRARGILRDELKLIEEIPSTGRNSKSYVRIKYVIGKKKRIEVLQKQLVLDGEIPEPKEPSLKENNNLTPEDQILLKDMFEFFYDKYPHSRRKSRIKNWEKFKLLLVKKGKIDYKLFDEIDSGLDKYLQTKKWKDAIEKKIGLQFIPFLSTWLNGKRWEETEDLEDENILSGTSIPKDSNPDLTKKIVQLYRNLIHNQEYEPRKEIMWKFIKGSERMVEFYKKKGRNKIPESIRLKYLYNVLKKEHVDQGRRPKPGTVCSDNTWGEAMTYELGEEFGL